MREARFVKRVHDIVVHLTQQQKRSVMLAVDLVLVVAAYLFTLAVQTDAGAFFASRDWWLGLPLVLLFTTAISSLLGIPNIRLKAYDVSGMGRLAVLAGFVALCSALLHGFARADLPLGTHVVFGVVYLLFTALSRIVMLEVLLAVYRRHGHRRRVLIYGAGKTGTQLAIALSTHDKIEAAAFVDDNPTLQGLRVARLPVHRPVDLPRVVEEMQIDRILLAMPSLSKPKQIQIARRLRKHGVEVQSLPSFAQLVGEEPLLEKMAPIPTNELLGREARMRATPQGMSSFSDRTVLVSGGGGTIGSELCRQILGCKPRKLLIFDISEAALYDVEKSLAPLAAEADIEIVPVLGSVAEERLVQQVLHRHHVDVILHAAAYKHVPLVETNAVSGFVNNVLGTWVLARAAREAGCARFILVSSDKAVRPRGIMGASKRFAELIVQDLAQRSPGTVFAMVRFGNVLGSSGSVVPLVQEQIARGGPVTLTDPRATRYFMTIEEAANLVLRAGSFAKGGEVFVLDMGQPRKVADLLRQIIQSSGYSVRDKDDPDGDIEIEIVGLRPGEKLHEELLIGEGQTVTAHEKIFRAQEAGLSEHEVAQAMRMLQDAAEDWDEDEIRAIASRWVEGFVEVEPRLGEAAGGPVAR